LNNKKVRIFLSFSSTENTILRRFGGLGKIRRKKEGKNKRGEGWGGVEICGGGEIQGGETQRFLFSNFNGRILP
jgi:hypothetical protein